VPPSYERTGLRAQHTTPKRPCFDFVPASGSVRKSLKKRRVGPYARTSGTRCAPTAELSKGGVSAYLGPPSSSLDPHSLESHDFEVAANSRLHQIWEATRPVTKENFSFFLALGLRRETLVILREPFRDPRGTVK